MGISTYEIPIPQKLLRTKVDKDLEFDTALADHCPDIARLIRVDCTPFAEKCVIEGDKAIVNGKAVYDILYETDYKNKLKFCSFTQDFSNSVNVPRNAKGDIAVFCDVSCQRINCKLLSPRRVVIRSVLGTSFVLEGESPVKVVAVNEDSETFFCKSTIGFMGRTSEYCETFRFGESISLSQNEKNIGEIVWGKIMLQDPQVTLSPGNAEIKANSLLQILYEDEANEGKYHSVCKSLPLNINFRNDTIEDFKTVSVKLNVNDTSFSAELDQYGESRIIKADFEVCARVQINEPKAYTVADDLFEKNYDGVCVKGAASVPVSITVPDTVITVETKITDIFPKPNSILEAGLRGNITAVEQAENQIKLNGIFTVSLLADTAEGVYNFDQNLPFEEFISVDIGGISSVEAQLFPTEVIPTLHSDGSITAKIIASVKPQLYKTDEVSFAEDVIKRTQRETFEDSALVYFFPQKGEKLWDIAKLYRADPEIIAQHNPESFDENGRLQENSKPILIKV